MVPTTAHHNVKPAFIKLSCQAKSQILKEQRSEDLWEVREVLKVPFSCETMEERGEIIRN